LISSGQHLGLKLKQYQESTLANNRWEYLAQCKNTDGWKAQLTGTRVKLLIKCFLKLIKVNLIILVVDSLKREVAYGLLQTLPLSAAGRAF